MLRPKARVPAVLCIGRSGRGALRGAVCIVHFLHGSVCVMFGMYGQSASRLHVIACASTIYAMGTGHCDMSEADISARAHDEKSCRCAVQTGCVTPMQVCCAEAACIVIRRGIVEEYATAPHVPWPEEEQA